METIAENQRGCGMGFQPMRLGKAPNALPVEFARNRFPLFVALPVGRMGRMPMPLPDLESPLNPFRS
jgi:hypothetical protein